MRKLPTLYKLTSLGTIQEWTIGVEKNTITTWYGKTDGKLMSTSDTIKEGKNIGRANATTSEEQAEAEAQSQWTKKLKSGYVKKIKDAKEGKVDKCIKGGYSPMLAYVYDKYGHKIYYPCYGQPKMDGHRCTSDPDYNLWSRKRNPITSLPHIQEALKKQKLKAKLDGEGYNHKLKTEFEEIGHFMRSQEPVEGHEIVQYHVFDVNMPGTFHERLTWLKEQGLTEDPKATIQLVKTVVIKNAECAKGICKHFLKQGYEGLILRNMNSPYIEKRSYDLQKMKVFVDDEFPIIGVIEGRGKLQGHVGAFLCKTKKDIEFEAAMNGEQKKLKEYWKDHSLWKNKILTVQYQGYTNGGKPRFAKGLRFYEPI